MIAVAITLAAATLALAILAGFTSAKAISLALRAGDLRAELAREKFAGKALREALATALTELREEGERYAKILVRRKRELELLHADLDKCGDDASRGRAAVLGIKRMLSPETDDDGADSDPDG